jgi:hypothetical protein
MTETGDTHKASEVETLRRLADLLCLWRLCGNASCRRARTCRGRVLLCARRNFKCLPGGVRDWFEGFLAAKSVGVPFEAFKDEMEGREETEAFFAWRAAAKGPPR